MLERAHKDWIKDKKNTRALPTPYIAQHHQTPAYWPRSAIEKTDQSQKQKKTNDQSHKREKPEWPITEIAIEERPITHGKYRDEWPLTTRDAQTANHRERPRRMANHSEHSSAPITAFADHGMRRQISSLRWVNTPHGYGRRQTAQSLRGQQRVVASSTKTSNVFVGGGRTETLTPQGWGAKSGPKARKRFKTRRHAKKKPKHYSKKGRKSQINTPYEVNK